jgi:hypothetical protein
MHFYINMSARQHRAGPPCPPGGSRRRVCGAGDLTRPAHRTSVIRSGRGGPPGRRRFPWMYTETPPSAALGEPYLSPVARILPPRCPVQHLSGDRRSPGPVTDLARSYLAHARPAAALAPAPDAGADGRNAARRASPRGHVIDGSAPLTKPSVGSRRSCSRRSAATLSATRAPPVEKSWLDADDSATNAP